MRTFIHKPTATRPSERALRDAYFAGAVAIVERFGCAPTDVYRCHDKSYANLDSNSYVVGTDAGTANVTVYNDWVAVRFLDPRHAAKVTGTSNPFSGKWNFHTFLAEKEAEDLTEQFIADNLAVLENSLRQINTCPVLEPAQVRERAAA